MRYTMIRRVSGAAALVVAAACQDLTATNPNSPDRGRALSEPGDVETLLASTWRPVWARTQGSNDPNLVFSAVADEFTTTSANFGAWTYSSEPKVSFDNNPTAAYPDAALNPYYGLYSGLSNVHDGLAQLDAGMKLMDASGKVDNTMRARAFAKMNQGIMHGLIGMIYDKGFIITEKTDISDPNALKNLPTVPYTVLRDTAISELKAAIDLARKNTFTITDWVPGLSMTNADLARLAHAWMVRIIAYTPRTPAARATADWATVIASSDSAVTADWGPVGGPNVLSSIYKQYSQYDYSSTRIIYYADNRLVGPADVSGAYQTWVTTPLEQRQRFEITTPDRRITGVGGSKTNGKYFRYIATNTFRADRGTYHQSFYQLYRWAGSGGGYYGQITAAPLIAISRAEMDLLKAEGLLRKNDAAGAATLINKSRVANGQLPVATTTGVSGADCVPRKDSGACGDLMDALIYEKRIETAGTDAMAFYDARGFGLLSKGTFLHLPIPGRELSALGMASYSFGGGGEGSVP